MSIDRVLDALRAKGLAVDRPRPDGEYPCQCPVCDGPKQRHLGVKGTASGAVLLNCVHQPQHDKKLILDALALTWADLNGNGKASPPPGNGKARIVTTYDYTDETGALISQVLRYSDKSFKQRHPDGTGGWVWDMKGVRRVLYRLPEVRAAIAAGQRIYLPEGEKDSDNLAAQKLVATTNAMGATKFTKEHAEYLVGAHLVILPDNDAAGRDHAEIAARLCQGKAASVKVLALPDLPEKGDISDWLEGGHSITELEALAEDCPEWGPSDTATGTEEPTPITLTPPTDAGNAELLAQLHAGALRYEHLNDQWRIWDGKRWAIDTTGQSLRLAVDTARARAKMAVDLPDRDAAVKEVKWAVTSESEHRVRAALAMASSLPTFATVPSDYDADPMTLSITNGTFDLRDGLLRPHDPADLCAKLAPVEYEPGTDSPHFDEFLDQVFDGKVEVQEYLRRAVGYSLTGIISEQVLFLLWGRGCNGKSTLLRVLGMLLGDYARNAEFATFSYEREKKAGVRDDLAALPGARLVTASEPSVGVRFSEGLVKQVTGGDLLTARNLYGRPFEYVPQFKLWLSCNHRPVVRDSSEGFWRRIHLVPFTVSFKGREDPNLLTKLAAERSGILNWALLGAMEWQKEGLRPPASVLAATAEYRAEEDVVGRYLGDCWVEDPAAIVRFADLHGDYQVWCERNGERPLSGKAFSDALVEHGYDRGRTASGAKGFLGLRRLEA